MNRQYYQSIWHSLDLDASKEKSPGLVKRLIDAAAQPELHLAVSTPDLKRNLMIGMPASWNGNTAPLPKWRGARISVLRLEEKPQPRTFLVIQQGDQSPREVFEALVSDVCDALLSSGSSEKAPQVLGSALERWKVFFEEQGLAGLSPDAQQGLYAELWFLREHLIPHFGPDRAVAAWTGGKHTNHDFQFPDHAIEVKSSAAQQHQVMRIKSERQLDTTGLDSLHVVVILLSRLEQAGETLPALVESIRSALAPSPAAARAFAERLLDSKYTEAHADTYETGYAFRQMKVYHVREGFPRVLETDLPEGVGDVAYSVVLSSCERFQVALAPALAAIRSSLGVEH